MDIVLSQKDADFILSYLRADLERVSKISDDLIEKQKDLQNQLESQRSQMGLTKYFMCQGMLQISNEMIKDSTETKSELMRCIEILTTGSAA